MEAEALIKRAIKSFDAIRNFTFYEKPEFNLLITGIGKISARLATKYAIEQGAEKFINAGVCGSLNDELKLFQICYPKIIKDLDLIQSGIPEIAINNKDNLKIGMISLPLHGGQEREIFQKHADLIDMESYGVASAIENPKKSLKIIKCISDFCQAGGSAEIKKNLPKASALLRDAIYQSLKG
jgi:nucleoside phosphorylase